MADRLLKLSYLHGGTVLYPPGSSEPTQKYKIWWKKLWELYAFLIIGVSYSKWPSLPPRKYSWHSFQLEAESIPVPQCGRKDYVNKKFQ